MAEEELQKDPVSRGEFIAMGAMGTVLGAAMVVPSAIFVLDPTIKTNFLGQTDVPEEWIEVGSVFEIPAAAPREYRVEFPQRQTFTDGGKETPSEAKHIVNALLVSWREGERPELLENRGSGALSETEIEELTEKLNVLSNHCTHLGCPVRWFPDKGEMLCPCHGGIYDINGGYLGGPPPRNLYTYVFEIREDGAFYVKHQFDGKPFVV